MTKIEANVANLWGDYWTGVLNPGDADGNCWLFEISRCNSGSAVVVEAYSEEQAIETYASSDHGCHVLISEDAYGDYMTQNESGNWVDLNGKACSSRLPECHWTDDGKPVSLEHVLLRECAPKYRIADAPHVTFDPESDWREIVDDDTDYTLMPSDCVPCVCEWDDTTRSEWSDLTIRTIGRTVTIGIPADTTDQDWERVQADTIRRQDCWAQSVGIADLDSADLSAIRWCPAHD